MTTIKMNSFSSSFFTFEVPVPDNGKRIKFLCAFLRIYRYGSPIFNRFLELYKLKKLQFSQNQPDFLEWFCGTFLSELCFILKNNCNQPCSVFVMETLSQLICNPDNFVYIFTKYTEEVMVKSWQHQLDTTFSYPNVSGTDESGTPMYD